MAKKKNQSNDNEKQNDGGNVTVVLKIDLHCEGCQRKVVKAIRSLNGVKTVKPGDHESNKITVIGKVDPDELRQAVEEKIKKKVELISPVTKKKDDNVDTKKQQTVVVKDDSKPKKFPVTTTVLKMPLHCQGCIDKIKKLVKKTKGFKEISIDKSKSLVTVKGGMDMKLLTAALENRFQTKVEVVQAKDSNNSGGEKKGKGSGGDDKEGKESGGDRQRVEESKIDYFVSQGQPSYPHY
nr:hypothetical protein [Tanacetum cinerariifolium]